MTRAVVVHTEGLDEYSNTGISSVIEVRNGCKVRSEFDAFATCGMPRVPLSALKGGDAAENARIIRGVLAGELTGPIADAIALNAGAGCYVYGLDDSIADGVKRCREVLASGAGIRTLEIWAKSSLRAPQAV
jgi:anthranilate phosphoribosyltransferase